MSAEARILIAGVGNVLRGDDGFGPAVIRVLEAGDPLPEHARCLEVGIGGIGLVQELMEGYDALVIVDAVDRGAEPGTLYILEPDLPELSGSEQRALAGDMHQAVPAQALLMARALGVLPPLVRIIGCQPAQTEELTVELSPAVAQTVPTAVQTIRAFLANQMAQAFSLQD